MTFNLVYKATTQFNRYRITKTCCCLSYTNVNKLNEMNYNHDFVLILNVN